MKKLKSEEKEFPKSYILNYNDILKLDDRSSDVKL